MIVISDTSVINNLAAIGQLILLKQLYETIIIPMDLVDASLVAAAERLGRRRTFTLDSDFSLYRINDKDAFEVIP